MYCKQSRVPLRLQEQTPVEALLHSLLDHGLHLGWVQQPGVEAAIRLDLSDGQLSQLFFIFAHCQPILEFFLECRIRTIG